MRVFEASIYRPAHNLPDGRTISDKFDTVLIPGFGGDIEVDSANPPDNLVIVAYDGLQSVHLQPAQHPGAGFVPWLDGGTLVYARHDAFEELCGGPVRLFDRRETWEEADRLRAAATVQDEVNAMASLTEVR